MTIEKTYDSSAIEAKLYDRWEKSGAFKADVHSTKTPYCIMMPPPNVTGSLHMGHALDQTIQDILVRYQRMKGKDVLWQPGTDHAGIATQMVVERQLAAQGINRRDMEREAFITKVWEWKAESGGMITKQLRRLGASCDWSRERFTMDEGLSRAVAHEFVTLYKEGLVYKDKRLVNWDPKMLTAVSDLEVEQRELKGHLWHFKYPIEGSDDVIIVATTRPETMLGDTAVAVHPENPKYKHLIGKMVRLPLADRLIPIVGDEYADPEKGTGAVKITPAHDFNDFEVGRRHKLPLITIFDQHAKLNDEVPEKYQGIERFEARKLIVSDMEVLGLLDKIEPHVHVVPHGDRSGVPIEPMLSEQWYCNAAKLAEEAIKAVEEGRTKFFPEQWTNTYYAWMRNIQPWCISRQLWWGHRIPVWYGIDATSNPIKIEMFVAESKAEVLELAKQHPDSQGREPLIVDSEELAMNKSLETKANFATDYYYMWQEPDTFDTWFSSGLWPFSTLGWPEKTPELARYYPTDVLVTGFDIIFFWVARMMMLGLYFRKEVPFKTVYIHALVRDEKGQKMSKSKGNVIDPLATIEKYGCDALRFTFATMSTPGRDIKLATSRIEGNRNFATKLWNAARFCQMNECVWMADFDASDVSQTVNKWIVGETKAAADKVASLIEAYRFDLAANAAYEFVWNTFCDWYVEFTKPILTGGDETAKAETRACTAWAMGQILHILHPIMPFITEELWAQFTESKTMLIASRWPEIALPKDCEAAQGEMNWLVRLVSSIRAVRAELNVPAGAEIPLQIKGSSALTQARLEKYKTIVLRMARLSGIARTDVAAKGSAQAVLDEATLILPLAEIIDLDKERTRLKKEGEKLAAEIRKIEGKLGNKDFIDRAPPEVIDEQKKRKAEAEATLAKLQSAQKSLA